MLIDEHDRYPSLFGKNRRIRTVRLEADWPRWEDDLGQELGRDCSGTNQKRIAGWPAMRFVES
jgi:hypothetical protein